MNPLNWKFEHQVALMICAGIGLVFGFIFGWSEVDPYTHRIWFYENQYHDNLYWPMVAAASVAGAVLGMAIIYAVQLMRR